MAEGEIDNSGSFLSKVGIFIIWLLVFIILLKIGLMIITNFFGYNGSPILINGMVSGSELLIIPQDPEIGDSKTVYRSINADKGIEFTWSCWIYLDNLDYNQQQYRCVFYKGNNYAENPNDITSNGLNFPNNSPGLYITPDKNDLVIIMNTYSVINETISITDIPVKKWVNVIIRCQNNVIDVYINGNIVKSHKLHGVPKQNYGNVYVGADGGFSGYVSNLSYYNRGLGIYDINQIVTKGPNTTMVGGKGSAMELKNPDYLSLRWFFYGIVADPTYETE